MEFTFKEYIDETRNWQYQSVTVRINPDGIEKELCYGSIDGGNTRFLEIYQGENYIVDSTDRSRSWKYDEDKIPQKWRELAHVLKTLFNDKF